MKRTVKIGPCSLVAWSVQNQSSIKSQLATHVMSSLHLMVVHTRAQSTDALVQLLHRHIANQFGFLAADGTLSLRPRWQPKITVFLEDGGQCVLRSARAMLAIKSSVNRQLGGIASSPIECICYEVDTADGRFYSLLSFHSLQQFVVPPYVDEQFDSFEHAVQELCGDFIREFPNFLIRTLLTELFSELHKIHSDRVYRLLALTLSAKDQRVVRKSMKKLSDRSLAFIQEFVV